MIFKDYFTFTASLSEDHETEENGYSCLLLMEEITNYDNYYVRRL